MNFSRTFVLSSFSLKSHVLLLPSKVCSGFGTLLHNGYQTTMSNNLYRNLHIINTFRNMLPLPTCVLSDFQRSNQSRSVINRKFFVFASTKCLSTSSISSHLLATSLSSFYNKRSPCRPNATIFDITRPASKISEESAIGWEMGAKEAKNRLTSAKQNIIEDITDTKMLMKEKMENIIEVSIIQHNCGFSIA